MSPDWSQTHSVPEVDPPVSTSRVLEAGCTTKPGLCVFKGWIQGLVDTRHAPWRMSHILSPILAILSGEGVSVRMPQVFLLSLV